MNATRVRGCFGAAAAVLGILAVTRAPQVGDTGLYANEISPYLGQAPGKELWEFGHLLLRPMGWALTSLLQPVLHGMTDWTPGMQVIAVLTAVNVLTSLVTVVLWYLLSLEWSSSPRVAWMVTLAFACGHGFLMYSHTGTAYVPGLACVSASFYAAQKRRPVWAGAFYGLGAALWFPYVLSGAGLMLAAAGPKEWGKSWLAGFRSLEVPRALWFVGAGAGVLLAAYGVGADFRGISTVAEFRAWLADSSHGWTQTLSVMRLGTGLPRSFLFLGRDGVLYRRYLFHDPYAPVGMLDLVQASLWKIAAFGVFALMLAHQVFRKPVWISVLLAVTVLPVLYFAVFLFEPGSPERYLPVMPMLLVATVGVFREGKWGWPQWTVAAFLLAVAGNNLYAFWAPRIEEQNRKELARIAELRPRLSPQSLVVMATNQDLILETTGRLPFNAINRPFPFPLYDAVEIGNVSMDAWQRRFTRKMLEVWGKGGEIWISQRLWQPVPRPEWFWVEGERSASWSQMAGFFARVEADAEEGGADGFRRVPDNAANRQWFSQFAGAAP